jgi:pilus assembly protein Flp/PilA
MALHVANELLPAMIACDPVRRSPLAMKLREKGDSMKSFAQRVRRFLTSEDGPTAVEYAVMLALIVVVCLVAITSVGTQASTTFSNVAGSLGGAS